MGKVRQKIASIIATVSVTGTLMASFPVNTNAAIVNENNENRATNVKISLEDAANYGKELAIEKNASSYGLADNVKEGAILHAWCWSFNTIKENLKDIAEAGFTTVQTSPANQCLVGDNGGMSIWSENGQGKWEYHYQPTDWKIGNYQLGTREEFKSMCEEADKYGIKIINGREYVNLCLYYPCEWNSTMNISDTIIPWISEWLYYFEFWCITGEWHGGGKHPTKKDIKENDKN